MLARRKLLIGSCAILISAAAQAQIVQFSGAPSSSMFPLTVSANGRFLQTASGQPFFMMADSYQGGAYNSIADTTTYLNARQSAGFNVIQIDLICDQYVGNPNGSSNYKTVEGYAPFAGGVSPLPSGFNSSTSPNATYWSKMDTIVSLMAARNMVAWLNPYETGPGGSGGGMADLVSAGTTACNAYGQFVANRYKNFLNVMYHFGNDYESSTPNDNALAAMIDGVKTASPNQLRAGETSFSFGDNNPTTSFDQSTWLPPRLNINGSYTYGPAYQDALTTYNNSGTSFVSIPGTNTIPPSPAILLEATYEFQQNSGTYDAGTPITLRRVAWWTILGGSVGYIYGNWYTWGILQTSDGAPVSGWTAGGWTQNLNSPGVQDLTRWKNFFTSIPWQNLIPDQTHVIGTSGFGTPSKNNPFASNTYVPISATADGHYAVAYFSLGSASSLVVDLTKFAGTITAQWFDPTNAVFSNVSGSPFTNTGTHTFTPIGNNSQGAGNPDWVLLLTA